MRFEFLFMLICAVFLTGNASAIIAAGDWGNGSQFATITEGDGINFDFDFFSMNPPMTINVKVYNSSGSAIYVFDDNELVNSNNYSKIYNVNQSVYGTDGDFRILIQGADSTGSNFAELFLTVNSQPSQPANNPPVFTSSPVMTIQENSAYVYDADAFDLDGDTLTYSLSTNPGWLSINPATGVITGTAQNVGADAPLSVVVTVADGTTFANQPYTLTILDVPAANSVPIITSTPGVIVTEGQTYTYDVDATDADGNVLTYSFSATPVATWLSINSSTGVITGTAPSVTANTNFNIVVAVSDGIVSANQQYILTLFDTLTPPANSAPIITSTPVLSVNENSAYNYDANATDADGDVLTYSLGPISPLWLSINLNTGIITGVSPNVTANANFNVIVVVSDGITQTFQTYAITVNNVPVSGSGGNSSNKKIVHYNDPDEGRLLEQENFVAQKISLIQEKEKSWFARLIEWLINFFRGVFS